MPSASSYPDLVASLALFDELFSFVDFFSFFFDFDDFDDDFDLIGVPSRSKLSAFSFSPLFDFLDFLRVDDCPLTSPLLAFNASDLDFFLWDFSVAFSFVSFAGSFRAAFFMIFL